MLQKPIKTQNKTIQNLIKIKFKIMFINNLQQNN